MQKRLISSYMYSVVPIYICCMYLSTKIHSAGCVHLSSYQNSSFIISSAYSMHRINKLEPGQCWWSQVASFPGLYFFLRGREKQSLVHTVCACAKNPRNTGVLGYFSVIFSVNSRKMEYSCCRKRFEQHNKALKGRAERSFIQSNALNSECYTTIIFMQKQQIFSHACADSVYQALFFPPT